MRLAEQERLLERADELRALEHLFDSVRSSGRGHLVLLAGEAGTGTSAFLQAFTGAVAGVRVLSGACEALQTARALGPLLDIAAETGGELASPVEGGAHPTDVLAALAHELRRRARSSCSRTSTGPTRRRST